MGRKDKVYVVNIYVDGEQIPAKQCTTCKVVKSLDSFTKCSSKGSAGGRYSKCRDCVKIRTELNKDKHKEYYKEYCDQNKEKEAQRKARYYRANKERIQKRHSEWAKENPERVSKIQKRYRQNNPEKIYEKTKRRQELLKALYSNWSASLKRECESDFNYKCVISEDPNYEQDHFIAISTGHGGTYKGNIILLSGYINNKKSDNNPFEWIKTRSNHEQLNFEKLVSKLAILNNLSVEDFKSFVYWCYGNPRTIEEVKRDERKSIDIWRTADE